MHASSSFHAYRSRVLNQSVNGP